MAGRGVTRQAAAVRINAGAAAEMCQAAILKDEILHQKARGEGIN